MKGLVKISVVALVATVLAGIMASSALAAMPANGAYGAQHAHIDTTLAPCVISGTCGEATQEVPGNGDEENQVPPVGEEPGTPDEQNVPDEQIVPGDQRVPDEPSLTTDETPQQPELTTEVTTPQTSKLPNTGSSLMVVAVIGAVLMLAALSARTLAARRAR